MRLKKLTFILLLICAQVYSQDYSKEIDDNLNELVLVAFSEFDDFSRYGLKWGMSIYEAEGYLKNVQSVTKDKIIAKGKLFGILDSDFILDFENDKLKKIYSIKLVKDEATPSEIQNFYFLYVSLIHDILNPANKVIEEGIRDFHISSAEIKARDIWVYNRGLSGLGITMGNIPSLSDSPVLIIAFLGKNGSDVVLTNKHRDFVKELGPLSTGFFNKKVRNPYLSYLIMK